MASVEQTSGIRRNPDSSQDPPSKRLRRFHDEFSALPGDSQRIESIVKAGKPGKQIPRLQQANSLTSPQIEAALAILSAFGVSHESALSQSCGLLGAELPDRYIQLPNSQQPSALQTWARYADTPVVDEAVFQSQGSTVTPQLLTSLHINSTPLSRVPPKLRPSVLSGVASALPEYALDIVKAYAAIDSQRDSWSIGSIPATQLRTESSFLSSIIHDLDNKPAHYEALMLHLYALAATPHFSSTSSFVRVELPLTLRAQGYSLPQLADPLHDLVCALGDCVAATTTASTTTTASNNIDFSSSSSSSSAPSSSSSSIVASSLRPTLTSTHIDRLKVALTMLDQTHAGVREKVAKILTGKPGRTSKASSSSSSSSSLRMVTNVDVAIASAATHVRSTLFNALFSEITNVLNSGEAPASSPNVDLLTHFLLLGSAVDELVLSSRVLHETHTTYNSSSGVGSSGLVESAVAVPTATAVTQSLHWRWREAMVMDAYKAVYTQTFQEAKGVGAEGLFPDVFILATGIVTKDIREEVYSMLCALMLEDASTPTPLPSDLLRRSLQVRNVFMRDMLLHYKIHRMPGDDPYVFKQLIPFFLELARHAALSSSSSSNMSDTSSSASSSSSTSSSSSSSTDISRNPFNPLALFFHPSSPSPPVTPLSPPRSPSILPMRPYGAIPSILNEMERLSLIRKGKMWHRISLASLLRHSSTSSTAGPSTLFASSTFSLAAKRTATSLCSQGLLSCPAPTCTDHKSHATHSAQHRLSPIVTTLFTEAFTPDPLHAPIFTPCSLSSLPSLPISPSLSPLFFDYISTSLANASAPPYELLLLTESSARCDLLLATSIVDELPMQVRLPRVRSATSTTSTTPATATTASSAASTSSSSTSSSSSPDENPLDTSSDDWFGAQCTPWAKKRINDFGLIIEHLLLPLITGVNTPQLGTSSPHPLAAYAINPDDGMQNPVNVETDKNVATINSDCYRHQSPVLSTDPNSPSPSSSLPSAASSLPTDPSVKSLRSSVAKVLSTTHSYLIHLCLLRMLLGVCEAVRPGQACSALKSAFQHGNLTQIMSVVVSGHGGGSSPSSSSHSQPLDTTPLFAHARMLLRSFTVLRRTKVGLALLTTSYTSLAHITSPECAAVMCSQVYSTLLDIVTRIAKAERLAEAAADAKVILSADPKNADLIRAEKTARQTYDAGSKMRCLDDTIIRQFHPASWPWSLPRIPL